VVHHETHRGRYLFHPSTTRDMVAQNTTLTLTADLSHWRASGGFLLLFLTNLQQKKYVPVKWTPVMTS
jgi:hypothetical protein